MSYTRFLQSRIRLATQALVALSVLIEGLTTARGDDLLQVVIERAPLSIRPAASYDIPLRLSGAREIQVVALVDGIVQPIRVKPGDRLTRQAELLRLDSRLQQLELERATAALEAAKQEQSKGAAAARVDVAQKELELAQLRLDHTIARMPWDGLLYRIHVAEGQYVRAGDPLVTIADTSRMQVDVPIDRSSAQVGDMVELKIDDVAVQGKLAAILPLHERLEPLRGLFPAIASGLVEVDNAGSRFLPGQTVYSPRIPRRPVGEVPNTSVGNTDDGGRKVQVIRDGVVRDVPVQLLGSVGEDSVWVSGLFGTEDQLILRTSEPLVDGTLVTPRLARSSGTAGSVTPTPASRPTAPGGPASPPPARTSDF